MNEEQAKSIAAALQELIATATDAANNRHNPNARVFRAIAELASLVERAMTADPEAPRYSQDDYAGGGSGSGSGSGSEQGGAS